MEVLQQIVVYSAVGYTFLLTDSGIENGNYSTDVSKYDEKNITDWFLLKCDKRNASNIMLALEAEIEKSGKCIQKHVDLESLENDFRAGIEANTLDVFFQKYCEAWNPLHGCLNGTFLLVEKCLDGDEKKQVDAALGIVDYIASTLCSDNAYMFRKFYTEGGLACLEERWDDIEKCIKSHTIKMPNRDEDCQDLGKIRICIQDGMKNSNKSGPAEVLNDLLELVDNKFCNSTISSGTRGSIEAIFLIALLYSNIYF
ncbi:hypothetical protein JTB14_014284 [Gonioctena quinquepunctata]|nr:hypothetical protein JTB14_014284 [Gonioctena quinquepunctata]